METYFTADLHLGHVNICEFADRPWKNVWEMDEILIANWNKKVLSDDLVYILGDICMGNLEKTLPKINRLMGNKILILGNHDRPFPVKKKSIEWFDKYTKYFDDIRINDFVLINNQQVLLSHFPAAGESWTRKDRFTDFRPKYNGWIMHGHTHSKEFVNFKTKHIHVGIDTAIANYSPINLKEIEQALKKISK